MYVNLLTTSVACRRLQKEEEEAETKKIKVLLKSAPKRCSKQAKEHPCGQVYAGKNTLGAEMTHVEPLARNRIA